MYIYIYIVYSIYIYIYIYIYIHRQWHLPAQDLQGVEPTQTAVRDSRRQLQASPSLDETAIQTFFQHSFIQH